MSTISDNTPYTSLPPVSPGTWASSASTEASLLPSPSSVRSTSPVYVGTGANGSPTTWTLAPTSTPFTTITSVEYGETVVYAVPATATPSATASGPNKTVTIVLSTVVTVIGLAAIAVIALFIFRNRVRKQQRQAWRARYPSQWSWDAKYHDAEPEPTPLIPTSPENAAAGPSAYAFAPTFSPQHSRFPSTDLPRTSQPNAPKPAHNRERSIG